MTKLKFELDITCKEGLFLVGMYKNLGEMKGLPADERKRYMSRSMGILNLLDDTFGKDVVDETAKKFSTEKQILRIINDEKDD